MKGVSCNQLSIKEDEPLQDLERAELPASVELLINLVSHRGGRRCRKYTGGGAGSTSPSIYTSVCGPETFHRRVVCEIVSTFKKSWRVSNTESKSCVFVFQSLKARVRLIGRRHLGSLQPENGRNRI